MLANYKSTINSLDAAKLNKADTAAMLANYAKQADITTGLNTKVNIADTASMLANYKSAINSLDAAKLNKADTANMLANYAKQADITTGLKPR
jgi:hypothetical protein